MISEIREKYLSIRVCTSDVHMVHRYTEHIHLNGPDYVAYVMFPMCRRQHSFDVKLSEQTFALYTINIDEP